MSEYVVSVGGGLGDKVWDKEFSVYADNIHEALIRAEQSLMEIDPFDGKIVRGEGEVFAIEQKP